MVFRLAACLLAASALAAQPLPGTAAVSLSGGFAPSSPLPTLLRGEVPQGSIYRTFGPGRAATGVFTSPAALEFDVAGYPTHPGIHFLLEDAMDPAQTLVFSLRDSRMVWRTRRWPLPRAWQKRAVRLIVEDTSHDIGPWAAFTLPRPARLFTASRIGFALVLFLSQAIQFALLLLPGMAAALVCRSKRQITAEVSFTILLSACGLAALLAFFAFVAGERTGRFTCFLVLFPAALLTLLYRRQLRPAFGSAGLRLLAVWFCAAGLYTSAAFLYRNDDGPAEQAQLRFLSYAMPPDNVLPFILAQQMFAGQQIRPVFFQDIQSSDRPPLQSGFMLLQRPLWIDPDQQYQLLAILLQTAWIPALWVFLRRAEVTGLALLTALAIPALSYFAFLHEVFVWPKLLSAAFGLLALSCLPWFGRQTRTNAILGGVLLALSLLSHNNTAFTFIGFGLVALVTSCIPWRSAARLLTAAGLVYLPWLLYQKLYDPPGDALLRLHLAGTTDRTAPLLSLILSSYAHLGLSGWLATKWLNLKFLFWSHGGTRLFHGGAETALGLSELSFFSLMPCLGLANVGGICRLIRLRQRHRIADSLMTVALVSIAIWILILFLPESTAVHQGSFLTVILLFTALSLYAADFSPTLAGLLISLQLLQFVLFVVFAKPVIDSGGTALRDTFPDVGMFAWFGLSLTALGTAFLREWRRPGRFSL